MDDQQLLTSICCLDRLELFKTEKPYEIVFKAPGDFPRTNMSTSRHHGVPVHDIRGCQDNFSIKRNGFYIMNFASEMKADEFDDEVAIKSIYLPQVAETLKQSLGASRVQVHDYMVRRSHAKFPISTGEPYIYEQPAMLLHIDTSPAGTTEIIKATARDNIPNLLNMRYQYVTVWKPIRGPVKRWPLMVVDNSTVNAERDLQKRDMVYPDRVQETLVAHQSDSYKFYYLSEQKTNEALVILQTDSIGVPGCPHTSFPSPNVSQSDPQRESIEVRTLVFYD